jgi:hypothetical protein
MENEGTGIRLENVLWGEPRSRAAKENCSSWALPSRSRPSRIYVVKTDEETSAQS